MHATNPQWEDSVFLRIRKWLIIPSLTLGLAGVKPELICMGPEAFFSESRICIPINEGPSQ